MPHSPDPSDFSRIRHDLRTPVNHIIGYAELLLEDNGLPTEFHADLQRIHTGGRASLQASKRNSSETANANTSLKSNLSVRSPIDSCSTSCPSPSPTASRQAKP